MSTETPSLPLKPSTLDPYQALYHCVWTNMLSTLTFVHGKEQRSQTAQQPHTIITLSSSLTHLVTLDSLRQRMNQPRRRAHLTRHNAHHTTSPPELLVNLLDTRTRAPSRHARQMALGRILGHIAWSPDDGAGDAVERVRGAGVAFAWVGVEKAAFAGEDAVFAFVRRRPFVAATTEAPMEEGRRAGFD